MASMLPAAVGDLSNAAAISAAFMLSLAERDSSLLSHPALVYAQADRIGSNVVNVPIIGYGADPLAATTPGSAMSATTLGSDSVSVTLATYGLLYSVDDLARLMVDGRLDPERFAAFAKDSVDSKLVDMVANITDGFTATVGTSGSNLTIADIQSGIRILRTANAKGAICGVLHPTQWADLQADALANGAALPDAMRNIVSSPLGMSMGNWLGVDWFVSTRVPTANAGADRAGALFTRGAVVWADAAFMNDGDPNIVDLGAVDGGFARAQFERVREGAKSLTSYAIRSAMGVSIGIDSAGVSVITDA